MKSYSPFPLISAVITWVAVVVFSLSTFAQEVGGNVEHVPSGFELREIRVPVAPAHTRLSHVASGASGYMRMEEEILVEDATATSPAIHKTVSRPLFTPAQTTEVKLSAEFKTVKKLVPIGMEEAVAIPTYGLREVRVELSPPHKRGKRGQLFTSVPGVYRTFEEFVPIKEEEAVKDEALNSPDRQKGPGESGFDADEDEAIEAPVFVVRRVAIPFTPSHTSYVVIPAKFETISEVILVRESTTNTPALYTTIERWKLVEPARVEEVEVPAESVYIERFSRLAPLAPGEFPKYEMQAERIEIKPVHTRLEVLPATFETVTEAILKEDATPTTPAYYETITRQKLVEPARVREIAVPGEYRTFARRMRVR